MTRHSIVLDLYLFVDKICPEPFPGTLIRVLMQQIGFSILLVLVCILDNNYRLVHRFPIMNEDRDFLANWVHFQEVGALVLEVLFPIIILRFSSPPGHILPSSQMGLPTCPRVSPPPWKLLTLSKGWCDSYKYCSKLVPDENYRHVYIGEPATSFLTILACGRIC